MNKHEAELFNFLRRANLEKYQVKMSQQSIRVSHLIKMKENRIMELAGIIGMTFGERLDLEELIEASENDYEEMETGLNTSAANTSTAARLNMNPQNSVNNSNTYARSSASSRPSQFEDHMDEYFAKGISNY